MFSINQNYQESVSTIVTKNTANSLALIKITKSPYPALEAVNNMKGLALIKITKSPYRN